MQQGYAQRKGNQWKGAKTLVIQWHEELWMWCYTWTEGLAEARNDAQITGFSNRSDCSAVRKGKERRRTHCCGYVPSLDWQLHIHAAVLDEHTNMLLWKKDTALKERDKDGTGFLFLLSSVCIFIILCKEKSQSVPMISFCWWSTSFCLKVLNTAMI